MLTRIQVKGYKSFRSVEINLKPFTTIVGPNNAGKSNLFDLLGLISRVAQKPLEQAFAAHRGDAIESFYLAKPDQNPCIEVTLDLDLRGMRHPYDSSKEVPFPYVRYQLAIESDPTHVLLTIKNEKLEDINPEKRKRRKNPFLEIAQENGEQFLKVVPERGGKPRQFPLDSQRSVMTVIDDVEFYPTLCAVQQSFASWRFFHFDPQALREPSPLMNIHQIEPNGRGLSGFLDTLSRTDEKRFRAIEWAICTAIPEVEQIDLVETGDRRRLIVLRQRENRNHTARVISDGTLRFLALAALAYAADPPALVCLEEPENGVHPWRLDFIVKLLRGIARERENEPRAQVLVNSHSPYLVDLLYAEEMVIAEMKNGETIFRNVDLFSRPALREMLESGEITLGEAWYQGDLHGYP